MEEEVEEKVEVEVEVWRSRRRMKGGDKRTNSYVVTMNTLPTYPPFIKVYAHRPWCLLL